MNYVYIIKCGDNSLYTGWTNDIAKRFKNHCEGKGAKYTRGRGPLELVYYETFDDKRDAMKRECYIKQLKKAEKNELVKNFEGNFEEILNLNK